MANTINWDWFTPNQIDFNPNKSFIFPHPNKEEETDKVYLGKSMGEWH